MIKVRKIDSVLLNLTLLSQVTCIVYDGPSPSTPVLEPQGNISKTSTFQCVLHVLSFSSAPSTNSSLKFQVTSIQNNIYQILHINPCAEDRVSLNLSVEEYLHQTIIFHVSAHIDFHINATVKTMFYHSQFMHSCKYGGLFLAEAYNAEYHENPTLCENLVNSRSFYSHNSSFFVSFYWYQRLSNFSSEIHFTLTNCDIVQINGKKLSEICSTEDPEDIQSILNHLTKHSDFKLFVRSDEYCRCKSMKALSPERNGCFVLQFTNISDCMRLNIQFETLSVLGQDLYLGIFGIVKPNLIDSHWKRPSIFCLPPTQLDFSGQIDEICFNIQKQKNISCHTYKSHQLDGYEGIKFFNHYRTQDQETRIFSYVRYKSVSVGEPFHLDIYASSHRVWSENWLDILGTKRISQLQSSINLENNYLLMNTTLQVRICAICMRSLTRTE